MGSGLGFGLGLGSSVVCWVVFDVFVFIMLESHVGQTNFPNFHALSYIIIQNCGRGPSRNEMYDKRHALSIMMFLLPTKVYGIVLVYHYFPCRVLATRAIGCVPRSLKNGRRNDCL